MTSLPTPEEFMAAEPGTDPDEPDPVELPPLESIADSLRRIQATFEAGAEPSVEKAAHDELRAEYDEIEDLHNVKQELIEQVLEVCQPSTSKLANNIRAVLEPVVAPPAAKPELEPAEGGEND